MRNPLGLPFSVSMEAVSNNSVSNQAHTPTSSPTCLAMFKEAIKGGSLAGGGPTLSRSFRGPDIIPKFYVPQNPLGTQRRTRAAKAPVPRNPTTSCIPYEINTRYRRLQFRCQAYGASTRLQRPTSLFSSACIGNPSHPALPSLSWTSSCPCARGLRSRPGHLLAGHTTLCRQAH